jgi:hypothetical protein
MAIVLKKSTGEIVQRTSLARVLSPLLIILTAGMVISCQIPNPVTSTTLPTITPGVPVSETPAEPTETPDGPGVTATPSPTPGDPVTPTPIVGTPVPVSQNLFANPEFNGGDRPVVGGHLVWGWDNYGCNREFIGHQCLAPRQGTGNPIGLEMRLPEWKTSTEAEDPFRQKSSEGFDTSAQWFTFRGTSHAGIYQVVNTIPGVPCIAGASVMSWSDNGVTGDAHQSWLDTQDNVDNSSWQILTQNGGSSDAFTPAMQAQRETAPVFGNTYDHFEEIAVGFTPTSFQTTIFFENVRLWPFDSNDNYVDDAWMYCGDGLEAPAPPAPRPEPKLGNEPPIEAVNDPAITEEKGKLRTFASQYIRADHCAGTRCPVVGGLGANQQTKYSGYFTNPDNRDVWLCVDEENARWIVNTEFPAINIWQCAEWTAYLYKDAIMGTVSSGW